MKMIHLCLRVVLLPVFNPSLDAFKILINLVEIVTLQLDDDFFVVRIACLLQEHLHDFGVHVFVELLVTVAAALQAIEEDSAVTANDNHEIDQRLRKHVTSVPVDDLTASLEVGFYGVQELPDLSEKHSSSSCIHL